MRIMVHVLAVSIMASLVFFAAGGDNVFGGDSFEQKSKESQLWAAIKSGDYHAVGTLLKDDGGLLRRPINPAGDRALHVACLYGHYDLVMKFKEREHYQWHATMSCAFLCIMRYGAAMWL